MPLAIPEESAPWLKTQPAWSDGESKFAEAAQSGDLGYTWGSYAVSANGPAAAERGHYVRAWSRDAQGRWIVVLDVLQKKGK
jgi:ketosteroid isomerase-like protein